MRVVKACIAIGGVPLVYPPNHPRACEVVEFPVSVPGEYTVTFGRPPRCLVYHVTVDEEDLRSAGEKDLRVKMVLAGVGRLKVASVVTVPVRDERQYQRGWALLFSEPEKVER